MPGDRVGPCTEGDPGGSCREREGARVGPCIEGEGAGGPCMVRSNASWVMAT